MEPPYIYYLSVKILSRINHLYSDMKHIKMFENFKDVDSICKEYGIEKRLTTTKPLVVISLTYYKFGWVY